MPTERQNLCTHKNEAIFKERDNTRLVKVSIVRLMGLPYLQSFNVFLKYDFLVCFLSKCRNITNHKEHLSCTSQR